MYGFSLTLESSIWYKIFMFSVVVVNLFILLLDQYPFDVLLNWRCEILNLVFTLIYILELVVKISAFGFKGLFKIQKFTNIFDCTIVLISLCDIVLAFTLVGSNTDN